MKTCANDSWLFICVFIYAVWLGGVSDGQEAARQQIPLMAPMHRSNLIAWLWGEVGADHPWSQALKWCLYPDLFHLCFSRGNNCMWCPHARAYLCRCTWTGLDTPFSLGTAGGCILEKSGAFWNLRLRKQYVHMSRCCEMNCAICTSNKNSKQNSTMSQFSGAVRNWKRT